MVEAVRNDPVVGKGSCSSIDECWDDQDLIEAFKDPASPILSSISAILWARKSERRHLEEGLNCRCGEDNDSQLLAYNHFIQMELDNPVG